jgi:ubiquitin carboxyl-terminal hydrolase 14
MASSTKCKVSVRWGKETFPDVEVDTSNPPLVFKSQLFTLSGVPPERQKVMIKGALLKDDDWGKAVPKDGMSIMMMGTAGEPVVVQAPANAPVFVEDLPEEEQDALGTKAYGSGLTNLGNTCYMNSTVQCLYSVPGLQAALAREGAIVQPEFSSGQPGGTKLTSALKELFTDLKRGGAPFPPFKVLLTLRERFPQFAQTGQHGEYMQQDAEECYSQVMYTLKEQLRDADGGSVVDKLFGVRLRATLKCEESGEELAESSTSYMLKCNIANDTNYLSQVRACVRVLCCALRARQPLPLSFYTCIDQHTHTHDYKTNQHQKHNTTNKNRASRWRSSRTARSTRLHLAARRSSRAARRSRARCRRT